MEVWRGLYSIMAFMIIVGKGEGQLMVNFYGFSCPNVEGIVRQTVMGKLSQTFTTVPGTLRLFFHDCFVEGCDASILIASANRDAEKDAPDNQSLAGDGFDTVIKAKQAVEAACPGVVSCADVLALASRDVVALSGGPEYNVELGRRDGLISKATRVAGNLPEPQQDLNVLNFIFSKNNLTLTDLVALSGAHTVGFSHCDRFAKRLYNFSSSSPLDPTLDPTYAKQLMLACPQNADPTVAISMDPRTPRTFDNTYYENLIAGKGLFTSDQVLHNDPTSRAIVEDFAKNPFNFDGGDGAFARAMTKLGRVGVKTGKQGEIRRDCTAFNS